MTYDPRTYWGRPRKRDETIVPIAVAEGTTLARTLRMLEKR